MNESSDTRYIQVIGSASGAGKSTLCLGLISWLLAQGYDPAKLAYCKPVTQCSIRTPVFEFCQHQGVAVMDPSALVFKPGYSRRIIEKNLSGNENLAAVVQAIKCLSQGKSLVVIDGIGSPATGSVAGVGNVDIAKALACKVIYVGLPGIGLAIDDTLLAYGYLQSRGIRSVGLVYNRFNPKHRQRICALVSQRLCSLLPNAKVLGFMSEQTNLCEPPHTQAAEWFADSIKLTAFESWLETKPN